MGSPIYLRSGFLSQVRRHILDKLFSGDRTWVVPVLSGPLKGFHLELNLRWEREFIFNRYEFMCVQILQDLITPGMTCYDIGAHVGYYTLLFAKWVGSCGKVMAFEPNKPIHERLERNISLNLSRVQAIIRTNQIAISNRRGRHSFFKGGATTTGRLVKIPEDASDFDLTLVESETLDSLVFGHGFPLPNVVKIDVEWMENLVIAGMTRILAEIRPFVFCEIHDAEMGQNVHSTLAGLDYRIFSGESRREWHEKEAVIKGHHILGLPREDEISISKL